MSQFAILKIEIDGHFHGGEPVKPWVAKISGAHPKYGLAREFLQPMNDWSQAKAAWSGNIYGRVAHFALREGELYEIQRCRGSPSKRHVVREFVRVVDGKRVSLKPEEALSHVDGGEVATVYRMTEDRDGASWVARMRGLGTPERLPWIVIDNARIYRLATGGVFEITEAAAKRFVGITPDGKLSRLTEQEAWSWLTGAARSA